MDIDPPFQETYKTLFEELQREAKGNHESEEHFLVEEFELPLVDINRLSIGKLEREECIKEMAEAASKWGFFQVVNHGVPKDLLGCMQREQMKAFHQPFNKKAKENFLNLSAPSYRWGNPRATCLRQLSWSEAFHIPVADISSMGKHSSLSSTVGDFAKEAGALAQKIAEILVENLGVRSSFFRENCTQSSSYVRMNRYPPCPFFPKVFGLIHHTDGDFLTIVTQDQFGGLQLKKDGQWIGVRPNPEALIINIGDLFQALSNDVYKSSQHRVIAPQGVERLSVAYFYCSSLDAVIQSCGKPAIYRNFSFREYRKQVEKDLQATGEKVGISGFLL